MVLAKSKNAVGLGNSLMNDRFGKGKSSMHKGNAQGITRTGEDGQKYITNNKKEAAWVKMRSVTEQAALDEFLSTAELAGTDFTAEKMNNVKIIHKDQTNPYLLSAAEERVVARKHQKNKARLTVPRRPKWDKDTTPEQLDRMERDSFLEWRRGLAELQENLDLLMTPFERNIEVWRQLWRVIERSDLVVQIVDARNPLLFRSEDLEKYVKQIDRKKRNLLLVNKADMMTLEQRTAWAEYFTKVGIRFRFFSAELAKEANESRELDEADQERVEHMKDIADGNAEDEEVVLDSEAAKLNIEDEHHDEEDDDEYVDMDEEDEAEHEHEAVDDPSDTEAEGGILSLAEQTQILSTDDLEALFLSHAPSTDADTKLQIGLVGYPNVGKSSTINSLLGAKKVSVSATPGKTKHFQTIHLSQRIVLCDCPGLVFPNFTSTKAELVVNGVLPIDQLRESMGPMGLVAQRIPRQWLEAVYGMKIEVRSEEEGGTGQATGEELAKAFALARGYRAGGAMGQVDESRAARVVLKDFVKGKLLHCHPPPDWQEQHEGGDADFNAGLYDIAHLPERRRRVLEEMAAAHARAHGPGADIDPLKHFHDGEAEDIVSLTGGPSGPRQGPKTKALDKRFFAPGQGRGQLSRPFHHKYSEQGQVEAAKQPSGRKAREMIALEKDMSPEDVRMAMGGGKKHFKANKKAAKKVRSEYD